jgi:hypothetical protein
MPTIHETIYRIWSHGKQDRLGMRILYSTSDRDGCRVFTMLRRQEWE